MKSVCDRTTALLFYALSPNAMQNIFKTNRPRVDCVYTWRNAFCCLEPDISVSSDDSSIGKSCKAKFKFAHLHGSKTRSRLKFFHNS